MTLPETDLKVVAEEVSSELRASKATSNRDLPKPLRDRFIALRSELFRRGMFDPVLVRFDTATVAQASLGEIADELSSIAQKL